MISDKDFLNKKAIVIDIGTGFSKSGLGGENQPRSIIPTVIGYPKYQTTSKEIKPYTKSYYVGEEANQLNDFLDLIYPFQYGVVDDWNAIEKIWDYIFNSELNVDPSKHPVLLAEAPVGPRIPREKMAEIMFETFNVPVLCFVWQAILSLFATRRTTGCVIDIGHKVTHIIPIIEGFVISHAIRRIDVGGYDITIYLERLLEKKGYSFTTSTEKQIVKDIKEKLCFISINPEMELELSERNRDLIINYERTNGEIIILKEEAFLAPECLFSSNIGGKITNPLDVEIVDSINSCDKDLQLELYENLILAGGSSLIPNLKERLMKELEGQVSESVNVNVIAPLERSYLAWLGGSIISSFYSFKKTWVTKREYIEIGPTVVHRCF